MLPRKRHAMRMESGSFSYPFITLRSLFSLRFDFINLLGEWEDAPGGL